MLINRDEDALSHSMQSSACRVVSSSVFVIVSESESDESDRSSESDVCDRSRTTLTTVRECESDECDMRTLYTDRTRRL